MGFLQNPFEMNKVRKPKEFPIEYFENQKRYFRILFRIPNQLILQHGFPRIPKWFPKMVIGFSIRTKGILEYF